MMTINFNRFVKLYHNLREPLYIRGLWNGVAAGTEHSAALRGLQSNSIVDIGANRGQFALVARKHHPSSRIISFEPLAEPAAIFRRVFADDRLTTLHEVAIGFQEQ